MGRLAGRDLYRIPQRRERRRVAEVDLLIGDASKAHKVLGWKPRVGFSDLVRMMYESDLEEERAKKK